MSTEPSIFRRSEQAYDDLVGLWRRRRGVCILVLVAVILPIGIPLGYAYWRLKSDNSRLEEENHSKTIKIQELQTELAPFKVIALEKFFSSDAAAMRRLAEHLRSVDADLKKAQGELERLSAKAEIPALRAVVSIRPNGREVSYGSGSRNSGGLAFTGGSRLSKRLSEAFDSMNAGRHPEAMQSLRSLIKDFPEWPYSYFYLGLITTQANDFQQAADRCAAFRRGGIAEPEHLLFEVMALTFLDRFDDARGLLGELKKMRRRVEDVPIVRVAPGTPVDIINEIGPFAEKLGLPVIK